MTLHNFYSAPLFGVTVTIVLYVASLALNRRVPGVHPLFCCCAATIALLAMLDIPYESYAVGGQWISFLLGPATVALAVPLHKHWSKVKANWVPLSAGVTVGTLTSLASNVWLVRAAGGGHTLLMTLLPKSATTPISIELVRLLGGIPELGAVFTVLTGLFGSMAGVSLLRLMRVKSDLAVGIAIGTAAHGIGTAKMMRTSEVQGAYGSLAMALTGILMSVLAAPLSIWLK